MNFPGNCFYNHVEKRMWVEIPKNASKSISHHLLYNMGWKNGNYIKDNIYDYEPIVIVRNSIDRWKGSTIEICYHHMQYNKFDFTGFEQWFQNKNFKNFEKRGDLHHQPISYFCKNLSNMKYIAMDENFKENVKSTFGIENLKTINSTAENEHKRKIEPYVDEILKDENFITKLKQFYKEDIELFETVKSK